MIFLDTDTLSYFFTVNLTIRDKMSYAINRGQQICVTNNTKHYRHIKKLSIENWC